MPQDDLFGTKPAYIGLRVDWEEVHLVDGHYHNLTVRRKHPNEGWQTAHVSRWSPRMMDLASTLMEDVVNAYLYDGVRGVPRACAVVVKVARQHERTCDVVGR